MQEADILPELQSQKNNAGTKSNQHFRRKVASGHLEWLNLESVSDMKMQIPCGDSISQVIQLLPMVGIHPFLVTTGVNHIYKETYQKTSFHQNNNSANG